MLNVDRLYRSAVLGVAGNGFIRKLIEDRGRFAVNRLRSHEKDVGSTPAASETGRYETVPVIRYWA